MCRLRLCRVRAPRMGRVAVTNEFIEAPLRVDGMKGNSAGEKGKGARHS